MKVKAKYNGSRQDGDSLILEFKLDSWLFQRIRDNLQVGDEYLLEATKYRKKRTLEQNALMWELLTQIDEHVNGTREPWQWYVLAIKQTGAKTKVVYMADEALDELKEMCLSTGSFIRAVEPLGMYDDMYVYRIYYGSSMFNTKEMSLLIDTVLDMAQLVGIDTLSWEDILR